jgi:ActR/RegA family two-component response regulator
VAAGVPESACLSSGQILGPRTRAGEVDAEQLTRALVKRLYKITGGNVAETARLTGMDRRTVLSKLHGGSLARRRKVKK